MIYVALLVASYIIGGIPVGVLVARAYGVDIFQVGSGNIGATNVSRILGWRAWLFVFVPDVFKGMIPAWVTIHVLTGPVGPLDVQTAGFVAGLVAVTGHCWSPFLRFKGGKGVATALGAGLGAAAPVALSSFALFGVVLLVTRYMAIASVLGVSATMLFGAIFAHQSWQMEPFYALLSASVAVRHIKNFKRLWAGAEPKFGAKKRDDANREPDTQRLVSSEEQRPPPADASAQTFANPSTDERT